MFHGVSIKTHPLGIAQRVETELRCLLLAAQEHLRTPCDSYAARGLTFAKPRRQACWGR